MELYLILSKRLQIGGVVHEIKNKSVSLGANLRPKRPCLRQNHFSIVVGNLNRNSLEPTPLVSNSVPLRLTASRRTLDVRAPQRAPVPLGGRSKGTTHVHGEGDKLSFPITRAGLVFVSFLLITFDPFEGLGSRNDEV